MEPSTSASNSYDNISFSLSENGQGSAQEQVHTHVPFNANSSGEAARDLEIREKSPDAEALSVEERIRAIAKEKKIRVALLTPCYGGMCHVNFMCCLINTVRLFQELSIPLRIEFCKNDSLVSRARNNLVAKAMYDKETTHLIFVDSDITWNPVDIVKLILADKDVNGGLYPVKSIYWERLFGKDADTNVIKEWVERKNQTPLKDLDNVDYIQQRLLRYNVNFLSSNVEINQNMMEVRHLATGFMMIKREVIEKMMAAFPSTKYVDDVSFLEEAENEFAYALFDCAIEDGHYLSEDWLFCSRWIKMGGKVYADVSINLTHTGSFDYRGSFVSTLV